MNGITSGAAKGLAASTDMPVELKMALISRATEAAVSQIDFNSGVDNLVSSVEALTTGSVSAIAASGIPKDQISKQTGSIASSAVKGLAQAQQNSAALATSPVVSINISPVVASVSSGAIKGVGQNDGADSAIMVAATKSASSGVTITLSIFTAAQETLLEMVEQTAIASVTALKDSKLDAGGISKAAGAVSAGVTSSLSDAGISKENMSDAAAISAITESVNTLDPVTFSAEPALTIPAIGASGATFTDSDPATGKAGGNLTIA